MMILERSKTDLSSCFPRRKATVGRGPAEEEFETSRDYELYGNGSTFHVTTAAQASA